MSFLLKLKSVLTQSRSGSDRPKGSWRSLLTAIGAESPNCPYCGYVFEKMPQRKRACPSCGRSIYSRKRPLDGIKVLLTEEHAAEGEAQSVLLTMVQEGGLEDAQVDAMIGALHKELGRVPTAEEVVVKQLLVSAAVHADAWQWGLYRNARFNLAESCMRRGLREDALRLYLEVCLVDLNGPRNCGTKDPEVVRRFPPFDASNAFLASGVVNRASEIAAELGLSAGDLRRLFDATADALRPTCRLPRATKDSWAELSEQIVRATAPHTR